MKYACFLLSLVILGGGFTFFPTWKAAADGRLTTCPSGDEAKRELVVSFLTEEKWADDRSELGISGIRPSQVRLLTDSQDASVCEQIDAIDRKSPPRYEIAYYEAGGYYFVVTEMKTEEGEMDLGQIPFIILDSTLDPVKGYLV